MKSKKAIGWPWLVAIALGVFVIVAVAAGPLAGIKNYIGEKIFGEKGLASTPGEAEHEFVPFSDEFLADEIKAMNSMNALACAITFVASGNPDLSICK